MIGSVKMKSILMVADHLGANGTVTYLFTISKALKAIGYTIVVIGRTGVLGDNFKHENIPVYEVNIPTTFDDKSTELQEKIEEIIHNHQIDLIHCHQVFSGIVLLHMAQKLNIPYVYTLHGLYNRREELLKILPKCNQIITVSQLVQEQLVHQYNLSSTFIPNGIDGNDYIDQSDLTVRKNLHIPDTGFVVFYASRLEFDKADICMRLLKAIEELRQPNLYALVAGEGFRTKQIHNMIKAMNRKRATPYVHLLGSQQDLRPFYRSVNVVVGTGRTAMEAISCEVPVIAAGAKGYSGIVTKENWEKMKYGHFADHHADQPIHQRNIKNDISQLMTHEKNIVEMKEIRQALLRDFNIEKIIKDLNSLYINTLN